MHQTTCTHPGCRYVTVRGDECNFHRVGYTEQLLVPELGPCHIWGGKVNKGYGYLYLPGTRTTVSAHRASYALSTGEDIKGQLVRHRCDIPLCIRREHLIAGTHQDNMADGVARNRFLAGADVHFAVLTEKQVVAIRERYAEGGITINELGRQYNVTGSTVQGVVSGQTWRRTAGPTSNRKRGRTAIGTEHYIAKLTEDDVREIRRKRAEEGTSYKALMEEYGLSSTGTIAAILSRHTWKHVE